jgi:carbon-monoxide dehydrogenase small subunit
MNIVQTFEVGRPTSVVWDLFQDIPVVVSCMPGAQLTEQKGDGRYIGRLGIKLGPFGASFEGEAEITSDRNCYKGHAEGRGVDKKGGSRSKLALDYKLTEVAASRTRVDINADVQLSGPIAQFGRTGIINETAAILITQFVKNVEGRLASLPEIAAPQVARLPSSAPQQAANTVKQISVLKIFGLLIASLFRCLVNRQF